MISIILVGLLATNFTIKKKHLAAILIIATPLIYNYIMPLFKYSINGKDAQIITLCDFSIKLFMIGLGNFGGLMDLIKCTCVYVI